MMTDTASTASARIKFMRLRAGVALPTQTGEPRAPKKAPSEKSVHAGLLKVAWSIMTPGPMVEDTVTRFRY